MTFHFLIQSTLFFFFIIILRANLFIKIEKMERYPSVRVSFLSFTTDEVSAAISLSWLRDTKISNTFDRFATRDLSRLSCFDIESLDHE